MITDNMVIACQNVLIEYASVNISIEDVKTILEYTPGLVKDLSEYYDFDKSQSGCGFDTADREWLMDGFAKFIGASHWPTYGEIGSEHESNFHKIYEAYKEKVR